MKLHLGHHFFGAGNLGDDLMLGGFLAALRSAGKAPGLTGCVPTGAAGLARRFPAVHWRPYDESSRRRSIRECDLWLGLGGSPWQSAVSPWFAEHLTKESALCAEFGRPMFYLGVGGQDRAAYEVPALRQAAARAEGIWTRDEISAEALSDLAPSGRVRAAADLAHVYFAEIPPPSARSGRLTAVLNFDFAPWAGLPAALGALDALPARERIWFAQEDRPLPGAERWLFERLAPEERARWRLEAAGDPAADLAGALARWPAGEWLLTSRYHATLAGAWSGSRAVALATNEKLRGAADECGYPLWPLESDPATLAAALTEAAPPPAARLQARAALARQACEEFFAVIGL